ncbi:MAG: hypothetical protein GY937_13595 [bacterium]|nr:hypothetical protein [bacterium]
MRWAAGLLVSLLGAATLVWAVPPDDKVKNPKAVTEGAKAEASDIPSKRVPDSLRNRNRRPVPEKPKPNLRPDMGIPKPALGVTPACGPGVWPLYFEFSAEPTEVWPGDSLVLRWRAVGPGNTQWRDPVHLTNGATGRRERVAPASTSRLAASSLREPVTVFTLETTCKKKELRVTVAAAPHLAAVSPSPYVCSVREGPDVCPGTLELHGRDFGSAALPGSRISIWREPAFRFALRVRSWSDSRVLAEMPSEMRNGPWYAQVTRGADATRKRDSLPRRFEVEYQAPVPVVKPAPRPSPAPPPRTSGSGTGGSEGGGCEEDAPCAVQPRSCSGRSGFEVAGTTRCRGDTAECVAIQGSDYCSVCGGSCGGCVGHSCSAIAPCAPGSICRLEHGPTDSTLRCAAIRDSSVAFSQPCTHINGFCWTPDELGTDESATMICAEAR